MKVIKLGKLVSAHFSTSERQKRLETRHNSVHFLHIQTSKSGPRPSVFYTFDLDMCFAPQQRALFRHLNFPKWSEHGVLCTFWLGNVLRATTVCTFSTSQLPKVVRTPQFFTLLTWKCASHHNGVQFFDISTSKSGPNINFCLFLLGNVLRATTACTFSTSQLPRVVWDRGFLTLLTWKCASRHNRVHFLNISTSKSGPTMVCFVHFYLVLCFAPQQRALFRHLNFQKWSEREVFLSFLLKNVLRATTACTYSTSQLPKVVRTWRALCLLTWFCAWGHNGVQFSSLIWPDGSAPAALASLLFDHPEPQKNRDCIFFLLTFLWSSHVFSSPLWLFPPLLFHLSILSEVWLLNFLRLWYHTVITIVAYSSILLVVIDYHQLKDHE